MARREFTPYGHKVNYSSPPSSVSLDQQLPFSSSDDYSIVYVQPSSLNTEHNCTSPNNPCKSVEDAISYANSIGNTRVHVYLMDGEYKCGMAPYQPLQSLILEPFNQSKRIQFKCNGRSLFTYLNAMNRLKLSRLELYDFSMNNDDNTLVSVPLIEIENSILNNSLIYESSRQFGTISVSIVNSQLEFVEFYATVTANFTDSTLRNIKHVQEIPSFDPGTFFNNCTIEKYQFISSSQEDMFAVEQGFSLFHSRVKDSDFLIYRTSTSHISHNTFTGSVTIRQSFLTSSKFENNKVSNGDFQFSAYYINVLYIGWNDFNNLLSNNPVFQIANTLQTMFQVNNFDNVKNGISVSQSNYISLFQTNFRNTSISLRVDSLMDVVQSSFLLDSCDFNNNGDLTIPNGVYIKANTIQIKDGYFNGNKAVKGGAVYIEGLTIALDLLAYNNSALMGGAIYAKLLGTDPLELRATMDYNTAQLGGAIFVENPKPFVILDYLECKYSRALFSGGCIYISEPGPYIESSFLLKDHNEAGSYGDFIGEPLNNITLSVDVISGNNTVVTKVIENQDIIYSQYPGQELTISIENLQTYNNGERVPVKKLQSQVDVFVSLSDGMIYSKKFIPNQLNAVTYSLAIEERQLKQVHGHITIQNIVQNITINILDCPKGKELQNPLSTGFVCYDTIVDNSALIIIPISVVLGILLMIVIILLLILTFRGVRHIYVKLNRLKRKEIAEKNLEDKIIENSFYYESQPLLVNSNNSNSSQSLIIPIEEISIEKKIGEGSNGIVYLGKWKGKQVAIKSLKSDTIGDEIGDFEREAAILNSLSHPNIVKFYGISMTSNHRYMVVEYINHGSLDRLIYNSRIGVSTLNLKRKLDILISVANGMKYLHTLNPPIIHR
ncbi:predicted protein [Naegleria gruberi]|uniref:Predicted protein n=1 Tax=Naegleria gruberi TaxID=5762 RepID=D2W479_NAEGR|nr:uncharacterized protein NAEGRDRAFT_76208 [Naegleria gruberi]EFC36133.1 predicted protein [Naegleria gruberi]|eukprot:XP_002668877.1 predicted protein [Naegleria gruberi strain NEG-M]